MIDLVEKAQTLWEGEVRRRVSESARHLLTQTLWEREIRQRNRGTESLRRPAPKAAFTVRDLPQAERPRERLAALGSSALSQQELLACLLGRGCAGESVITTAQRLLSRFGSLHGIAQAPLEELASVRGVGPAKAAQLKAAGELSRRAELAPARLSGPIESPLAAMELARRHLSGRRKEHFIALLLDARHRVMKISEISVGSLEMSIVHPRETFQEAIAAGASAMMVAHNHPSGDPSPSREDLDLTRRLVEAGKILGIPVLDHLIVGQGRVLSLKAGGFLDAEA